MGLVEVGVEVEVEVVLLWRGGGLGFGFDRFGWRVGMEMGFVWGVWG